MCNDLAADRWMSLQETAAYVGVTTRSVRTWVASGSLPGHGLPSSHLLRFKRSEIDAAFAPVDVA